MHLKNFSLITRQGKVELAPAYDYLNTTLAFLVLGKRNGDLGGGGLAAPWQEAAPWRQGLDRATTRANGCDFRTRSSSACGRSC